MKHLNAIHRAPVIGQLRNGEWVIFNMDDTPLWDAVFKTRIEAACALSEYRIKLALEDLDRRVEAARMGL